MHALDAEVGRDQHLVSAGNAHHGAIVADSGCDRVGTRFAAALAARKTAYTRYQL
jgi:hypothetical protein